MGNEKQAYCGKHYYDKEKYDRCPYCYGEAARKDPGATMPERYTDLEMDDLDLDLDLDLDMDDLEPTESAYVPKAKAFSYVADDEDDDERTKSAYFKEKGVDPVVGWLVALSGNVKGTDYSIRTGNNLIGRNPNMDICIRGDLTISKENQAIISYDARHRKFFFTPGNGKNIVYVNGNAVFATTEIVSYDIIEMGVTKFVFVPFCGENFDWESVLTEQAEQTEGE